MEITFSELHLYQEKNISQTTSNQNRKIRNAHNSVSLRKVYKRKLKKNSWTHPPEVFSIRGARYCIFGVDFSHEGSKARPSWDVPRAPYALSLNKKKIS